MCKETKKGVIWSGLIKSNLSNNGKYARIAIHVHSKGKDVPTGTFNSCVKDLHFENATEFFNFLRGI